jgi:hypothetical protein
LLSWNMIQSLGDVCCLTNIKLNKRKRRDTGCWVGRKEPREKDVVTVQSLRCGIIWLWYPQDWFSRIHQGHEQDKSHWGNSEVGIPFMECMLSSIHDWTSGSFICLVLYILVLAKMSTCTWSESFFYTSSSLSFILHGIKEAWNNCLYTDGKLLPIHIWTFGSNSFSPS